MTDSEYAAKQRHKIVDDQTHNCTYYGKIAAVNSSTGTGHISIVAPNGDAVACSTTVNHQ